MAEPARADTWDDVMGWTREGMRPVLEPEHKGRWEWWYWPATVTQLGRWLVDVQGYDGQQLQAMYESPHDYSVHYEEMTRWQRMYGEQSNE